MRRLITTISLTIAVLLGSTGVSWSADFQKGLTAYRSGDYATALREWTPLALQGNAGVQNILGFMHQQGKGVPQDYKTALKWYRLSAEQGFANAQNNLGVMYEKGLGVPQDDKTALKWFRLAAKQGYADAQNNLNILEGRIAAKKPTPAVTPPSPSTAERENERLLRENARLKRQEQEKREALQREIARLKEEKRQASLRKKEKPQPIEKTSTSGSGFFVSKSGHVVTNQHVVDSCKKVTVGDNPKKQVTADILETDRRNDLALLQISSLKMASAETRSLVQKLGIKIVPLAGDGLLRSEDVDLGEDILVAGYPFGELFSDTIKVTKGIISANKGLGGDVGQFQMDAAVQPGSSGGPIYDNKGNIVGVVVANLNKLKFAKQSGSLPELVNFGIKASTVRQFLIASGLPTKLSARTKPIATRDLAKIATKQTVMVQCHQ